MLKTGWWAKHTPAEQIRMSGIYRPHLESVHALRQPARVADLERVKRPVRLAVVIFLVLVTAGLFFHGRRVAATNDEGILLDAAQRIRQGERPYTDFWTYMSPGSYWLQATVFRVAGVSQLTGRVIVVADFALQCALLFWIGAQLASLGTAFAVLLAFLGFQIAD